MVLNTRRAAVLALILVCFTVAFAAGGRAAMVVENKGKSVLVDGESEAQLRTLQVLTDGSLLQIGEDATLKLSFFKSGQKETITGPCTIKIGLESSQQIAGTGHIEVQSARDASTELDGSSNLRRTGGAMQAGTGLVPENTLAFVYEGEEALPEGPLSVRGETQHTDETTVPSYVIHPKPLELEFVGLSYSYLTPEEARTIQWNSPEATRLDLYHSDGIAYARLVGGLRQHEIGTEHLLPGETHLAVLRNYESATQQYFRIFSQEEAREYRELVREIESRESGEPRSLYTELIYLNTELGLLTRAKVVAEKAVAEFPDDEGFQAALKELKAKLRVP